jgi:hypothetical protein
MSAKTLPAAVPQTREYFEEQHRTQVTGLKTLHANLAADIDTLANRNAHLSNHASKYGINLSALVATPNAVTPSAAPSKRGRPSIPYLAEVRAYINSNKDGFTMAGLVKQLEKDGVATKKEANTVLQAARHLEEQKAIRKTRRTAEDGTTTIYEAVS